MAYVVRTAGSELTEEKVIQFVANQVDLIASPSYFKQTLKIYFF
jgi:hypothetical protein